MPRRPSKTAITVPALLLCQNADLARSLSHALSEFGFETAHVENIAKAVKQIEKQRPELILLHKSTSGLAGLDGIHSSEMEVLLATAPVVVVVSEGNVDTTPFLERGAFDTLSVDAGMSGRLPQLILRVRNQLALMRRMQTAEASLHETEKHYRELIENQGEGIGVLDSHWTFVLSNPAAEEIFGITGSTLIGRRLAEWVDISDLSRRFGAISAAGEPRKLSVELTIRRPNGATRDVLLTATPWRDGSGNIIGAFTVLPDMSVSREFERALSESETRYRIVADNTYDWEFWSDPEGRLLWVSPSAERITGYSPEEFLSDPGLQTKIVHPGDQQAAADHLEQVRQHRDHGENYWEYRIIRRDGSDRWISHVCQRVFDESGRFLGIRGSNRDITRQKAAEADLSEQQQNLASLLDAIHETICLITPEGVALTVNGTCAERLGLPPAECIGQNVFKFLPPEVAARRLRVVEHVVRTGRPVVFEDERDGHYLHSSVYPVTNDQGEVTRVVIYGMDITDRRQVEQSLETQNAQLKALIESSDQAIFSLDWDYRYTAFNECHWQVMKAIFGAEIEIGASILDYHTDPNERAIAKANLDRALGGETLIVEHKVGDDQFERRHYLVTHNPIRTSKDVVTGVAVYGHDLTTVRHLGDELREREAKLYESNQIMAGILSHTHMQVVLLDAQFNFIWVNASYADTCRQSPDFFPGKNHFVLYPHDENQAIFQQVVDTGEPYFASAKSFTFPDQPERGETYWDWSLAPIKDQAGRVIRLVFTLAEVTDRVQAQAALRESEKEHRTLISAMPDVVMRFDRDGRHLFTSSNVEQVSGISAAKHFGKTHRELGFPDSMCDFWEASIRKIFDERTPQELEFGFDGPDRSFVFNWRLVPEFDDNNNVVSVLSISRDVTDHRQAEQMYQTLFREMLDGIALHKIICDAEGNPVDYRFLEVNPAFEQITGLKAESILGKTALECLPGLEPEWIQIYGKVALTGEPAHFENYSRGLDKYFEVTAYRHSTHQFVTIFKDMTERKHAEIELRRSKERLDLAQKASNAGIWDWDLLTNKLIWSPMMYEVFGLDPNRTEATFETWDGVLHPEDKEIAYQRIKDSIRDHTLLYNEYRIIRPDGQVRWISAHGTTEYAADGTPVRAVGTCMDVTPRKIAVEITNSRLHLLTIAEDLSLKDVLQATLAEAERLTGSRIGFYHFVDEDQETLSLQAWSTRTLEEYCSAEGEGRHYPISEAGVWVDCVRMKQPVIHNDYESLSHKKGLPKGHAAVQRELAVPIFRKGRIVAVLGVGNKPVDYHDGDVQTVSQLADIAWDIAARKRTQEALLTSEERFHRLSDMAPMCIYLTDAAGKCIYTNRRWQEAAGLSAAEALGDGWIEGLHPEDRESVAEAWTRMIESEGHWGAEYRFLARSGKVTWVEGYASPMRNMRGQVIGYIGCNADITERKHVEQVLRRSEARYRLLVQTSPFPVVVTAVDSPEVLFANNYALKFFGIPSGNEGAGLSALEFWRDPADRQQIMNKLNAGFPVIAEEVHMKTRSGDHKVVLISVSRIEFDGRPATFSVLADITDRKRMETALRQSEERFRHIVESANDTVWETNEHTQFTYVSPHIKTILGYEPEEVLGKTPFDFMPDEEARRAHNSFDPYSSARKPFSNLINISSHKDGRPVFIETNGVPVINDVGRFCGFRGVDRDVTERVQAMEALRESDQRFRTLFDSMLEGYAHCQMIYNDDGTAADWIYLNVNTSFGRITHLGDVIGKRVTEAIPGIREMNPDLFEIYGRVAAGGAPETFEIDFSLLGTWLKVSAVCPQKGYFVAIFEDVSEQKRAEERLRESEAQLRVAQKMEAIGRLAGGVAHDFNNLLTVITGHAEMALSRLWEGDPLRPDVEEISKTAQRAGNLTRQLLTFSRRQVVTPVVFDLNESISNMQRMLGRIIGEQIELSTSYHRDLWAIKADPGQIEQVIVNLVVNAHDAMPKGGCLAIESVNVYLDEDFAQIHAEVTPGKYVLLSVSDTGIGMSPETQARIFEPFFTTKPVGKGTGLGLATAYGIVRQCGGHIFVRSEEGKGTTFSIYIPAIPDARPESTIKSVVQGTLRGTESILLVEDNPGVRMLFAQVLSQYGYRVSSAATAEEALELYKKMNPRPDLVVSDVVMPGMNGAELAERIRSTTPSAKFLLMSGYTADAIPESISSRHLPLITKPFGPVYLITRVREMLS